LLAHRPSAERAAVKSVYSFKLNAAARGAFIVALLCAAAASAGTQTTITQCNGLVTSTGVLGADIDCTGTTGIPGVRLANGASLSLGGHTVKGGIQGILCEGNCTVTGPGTIRESQNYGILSAFGRVHASNLKVMDNPNGGIGGGSVEATAVEVSGNERYGVLGRKSVRVIGSTISDNHGYAVECIEGNALVEGSVVTRNEYGVFADGKAKIAGCSIDANEEWGVRARTLTVVGSNITGNGTSEECDWEPYECGDVQAYRLRAHDLACNKSGVFVWEAIEPTGETFGVCTDD
jgi:hypothetical protein